jgi:chromosome segregation ATPase
MEYEERLRNVENVVAGMDHGRFERIEDSIGKIFRRIDEYSTGQTKLQTEMVNVQTECGKHETSIETLQEAKAKNEGGLGALKWIIPTAIAVTGILVAVITWIIDKIH